MASYYSTVFFLAFLPICVLVYSIMPKKVRWAVLLLFSYAFFYVISHDLSLYIILSTISIYALGLIMESFIKKRDAQLAEVKKGKKAIRQQCKSKMKICIVVGVVFNFGLLIVLKYLGFFAEVASAIAGFFQPGASIEAIRMGVPIGISFYTLMAASYLIDIYRETIKPDKNIARVALYLSFFPQIMEGPISRYTQTAQALTAGEPLNIKNVYYGVLRIIIGFAKKIIIADRLNMFVKTVFDNHTAYDGGVIALVAIFYTIQLYCDFSGTMDVAIGMARVFNVKFPENFRQPFFSKTSSEFWQRWHITLGTWFKDYVYYPVSLSKPIKNLTARARKRFGNRYGPLMTSSVALFCVWLGNGLWHGAGSQYIFFGMYYFVLILAGGFLEPVAQSLAQRFGINRESKAYRGFQIGRTCIVIFIGELFFRATSLEQGFVMCGKIFTQFSIDSFMNGTIMTLKLDGFDYIVVAIAVLFVLILDIANEKGHNFYTIMLTKPAFVKWLVCVVVVVATVVFGGYGHGYAPVNPMYASF